MGVRYLTAYLRPYADEEALNGKSVVIDGSAFAHHIYYLTLSCRSEARNAFEALPTYEEVGNMAIAWLDELDANNVTISKIYFDGFLPHFKFKTRLERLSKYSSQLAAYHATNPTPWGAVDGRVDNNKALRGSSTPAKLRALPPLPFLVPSVIEKLIASRYKCAEVVPHEADFYCARYAEEHGAVVLTGDSDLLVHDLGINGSVCFFSDINIGQDQAGGPKCLLYKPAEIARRLCLSDGIKGLAFEIVMDPFLSFAQLHTQAKRSQAIKDFPDKYRDFLSEYKKLSSTATDQLGVIITIDPRTAEFVLQHKHLAIRANQHEAPEATEAHIFLPFLLDCPVQTSAWEISQGTRQLAYGILQETIPHGYRRLRVFEHKKGLSPTGRELAVPKKKDIWKACESLRTLYEDLGKELTNASPSELWMALAVTQGIVWADSQDKLALSFKVAPEVTSSQDGTKKGSKYSWDLIHFLAQIQACLYSLRMLDQLSGIALKINDSNSEAILKLRSRLEMLPKLAEYHNIPAAIAFFKEHLAAIQIASCKVLGIECPLPAQEQPSAPSAKEKRKRPRSSADPKRQRSKNPFDILSSAP